MNNLDISTPYRPLSLAITNRNPVSVDFWFWPIRTKGIIQYVICFDLLLWLCNIIIVHPAVACIRNAFLLIVDYYSIYSYTTFSSSVENWWTFRLFLILEIVNKPLYKFVCGHIVISFAYIPGVELLGSVETMCLTFWGSAKLFAKDPAPFYIPMRSIWTSCFSIPIPTFVTIFHFHFKHASRWAMACYCGFDLYFSSD